jgi:hypothetical protein
MKITYDILLYAAFREVRAPDEVKGAHDSGHVSGIVDTVAS